MKKNLVSSYTGVMWILYSGEVRGEVGTRSCMCCVGRVVWVHGGLLLYTSVSYCMRLQSSGKKINFIPITLMFYRPCISVKSE